MSIRPCENIVELPKVAVYDVLQSLTEVEDLDKRWQEILPEKPLTYAYLLTGEYSPIHLLIEAVVLTRITFIPRLYEKENALLNLGDTYGWTALHHAVALNKIETVETLLYLNADPNLSSIRPRQYYGESYLEGSTSLDIALTRNKVDMAVLLLKFDAQTDVDKRPSEPHIVYSPKGVVLRTDFAMVYVKDTFNTAKAREDQERQKTAEQIDIAIRSCKRQIPLPLLQMICKYV